MIQDGLNNVVVASIVHEEDSLANAPERLSAELVRTSHALVYAIGKVRAHVVYGIVGKWSKGRIAQWTNIRGVGGEGISMAENAAYADLGRLHHAVDNRGNQGAEDCFAVGCRCPQRIALGVALSVEAAPEIALIGDGVEAHEDSKVFDVRGDLAGIISSPRTGGYDHMSVVFRSEVRGAAGGNSLLIGEDLIGHAKFNIGGFAGKQEH